MLVYRVCSKAEIELIFNHGIEASGSLCEKTFVNTHNYQSEINYLHFFLHKSDILYIKSSKDNYICTYDIPSKLLDLYCGVGIYLDYINFRNRIYVVEFAIPSQELKFDYLKRVDELIDYIDFEDFLDGNLNQSLYQTIYDSSKPFSR